MRKYKLGSVGSAHVGDIGSIPTICQILYKRLLTLKKKHSVIRKYYTSSMVFCALYHVRVTLRNK